MNNDIRVRRVRSPGFITITAEFLMLSAAFALIITSMAVATLV